MAEILSRKKELERKSNEKRYLIIIKQKKKIVDLLFLSLTG